MAEFVLNRDYRLISGTGHTIQFIKGEPTFVPQSCVREVIALGAESVDEIDKTEEVLGKQVTQEPEMSAEDRIELIKAAFPELEARNRRDDFTAGGQPTVKALKGVVGFTPEKREIETTWLAYKQEKVDAQ